MPLLDTTLCLYKDIAMDLGAVFQTENPAARLNEDRSSAFRDADFLAIMLAELSNQDPFEPMETAKLVENMQKMQDLANTRFERYRNDLRWAQELIGQEVVVSQNGLSEEEAQVLRDRGFNPDIGYGVERGQVSSYRVMGESVWITVNNKDYQIDNVQRIEPQSDDINSHIEMANNLIGFFVSYSADTSGQNGAGLVSDVQWDSSGDVFVSVDGAFVPYRNITSIGLPGL